MARSKFSIFISSSFENLIYPHRCLRKVSVAVPLSSVVVNGFEIFESSRPHTQWGIPHTSKKLTGNTNTNANGNLPMTSSSSCGLSQYSSSKLEKQSQNNLDPGSLLTTISQGGHQSPSVSMDRVIKMFVTVDRGDSRTSADSDIQIIKDIATPSITRNNSDSSSSVAALNPSSIAPEAPRCEELTALPGMIQ